LKFGDCDQHSPHAEKQRASLILYLDKVVGQSRRDAVFDNPRRPDTKALLPGTTAVDKTAPRDQILKGELPAPIASPGGCVFQTRCPIAGSRCKVDAPLLEGVSGRAAACFAVPKSR